MNQENNITTTSTGIQVPTNEKVNIGCVALREMAEVNNQGIVFLVAVLSAVAMGIIASVLLTFAAVTGIGYVKYSKLKESGKIIPYLKDSYKNYKLPALLLKYSTKL